MRSRIHAVTAVMLFIGALVAVALAFGVGYWLDAHRAIGTTGVIAFLVATAIIVVGVEVVAGLSGEWLERHRVHAGDDHSRMTRR
jgi:hypothetical protein